MFKYCKLNAFYRGKNTIFQRVKNIRFIFPGYNVRFSSEIGSCGGSSAWKSFY